MKKPITLPIDAVLVDVASQLANNDILLLQAEPGAGKSTHVPLHLLQCNWLNNKKIVMLEPRRLAVKSLANYLAQQLGETVGQTVGYQVKNDRKLSAESKLEIVTEGILTRRLQSDPELSDTALIIFDEFHERSLQADLALTLCLDIQSALRDDLKLLIMSATIDTDTISQFLNNAPVINCPGRTFPVKTFYQPRPIGLGWLEKLHRTVLLASAKTNGDILIFLAGQGAIFSAIKRIEPTLDNDWKCLPLYGSLANNAQQEITQPQDKSSKRRIIFSTNIAETSLTIPNITCVIDTGLAKKMHYDVTSGMSRLETVSISQASAEQRRGRAGRVIEGECYRLWSESQHTQLQAYDNDEILEADLSQLCLDVANWGETNIANMQWLTKPPVSHIEKSQQTLRSLGLLNERHSLTTLGKQASALTVHPRFASMILRAKPLGLCLLACDLAAILSEKDLFMGHRAMAQIDISARVERLHQYINKQSVNDGVSNYLLQQINNESNRLFKKLKSPVTNSNNNQNMIGLLIAFAYPDRIAQMREHSPLQYVLANGKSAQLKRADSLFSSDYLAIANLEGQRKDSRIYLAAPLTINQIKKHFSTQISEESFYKFDEKKGKIFGVQATQLQAITLKQTAIKDHNSEAFIACLKDALIKTKLELLPWSNKSRQWLLRAEWLGNYNEIFKPFTLENLIEQIDDWLIPYCMTMQSIEALKQLNLIEVLSAHLGYQNLSLFEKEAPSHYTNQLGKQTIIHYSLQRAPYISVQLQSLFGEIHSPMLAFNQVPLNFELLSPAQHPIQITNDLNRFWQNSYQEIAKEMRGRYPKHRWPEEPLLEKPGRSIKQKQK